MIVAFVSQKGGSQLLDLQVDALREAGIATDRIYEDRMSGRHDATTRGRGSMLA